MLRRSELQVLGSGSVGPQPLTGSLPCTFEMSSKPVALLLGRPELGVVRCITDVKEELRLRDEYNWAREGDRIGKVLL